MLLVLWRGEEKDIQSASRTPKVSNPLRYRCVLEKSLIRFSAGSPNILRLPVGSFNVFSDQHRRCTSNEPKEILSKCFQVPIYQLSFQSTNRFITSYLKLSILLLVLCSKHQFLGLSIMLAAGFKIRGPVHLLFPHSAYTLDFQVSVNYAFEFERRQNFVFCCLLNLILPSTGLSPFGSQMYRVTLYTSVCF